MTSPAVIEWAMNMANLDLDKASKRLNLSTRTVEAFLDGSKTPSYANLSKMSKKFHIPIGFLFLSVPCDIRLTISDFRTHQGTKVASPSLDLLEVVNTAELKQEWYREFLMQDGGPSITQKMFAKNKNIPEQIRDFLDLNYLRGNASNHNEFLTNLINKLQENNFIVMRNSIVGDNAYRPLKVEEFKGFAMYDDYAPLIFINGKDFVSSQIFTVMHELAHVFLKESGVDNKVSFFARSNLESKCNKIAAEVLVPDQDFNYTAGCESLLAGQYKVSELVILIKARQMGLISDDYFYQKKENLGNNIKPNVKKGKGGSYYNTKKFREGGDKFLRCVIASALEGKTTFKDAHRLTGIKKRATFDKYAHRLGL